LMPEISSDKMVAARRGACNTPASRLATTTLLRPEHAMTIEDPTPERVAYKDVVGFPGYRVGSDGSMWTCRSHGELRPDRWRPRKTFSSKRGYKNVALYRDGKYKFRPVHRIVLEAFVGPAVGRCACHNNGNPSDNRLENLRWGTHGENATDMVSHGRSTKGVRNRHAKLDENRVREIREMWASGKNLRSIADEFGVTRGNVHLIVTRKTWGHVP